MPQHYTFEVSKVFAQKPYYVISKSTSAEGIFSLPPDAVVTAVGEPKPSVEDIEDFLDVKVKAKVVGYKLLWDGRAPLAEVSKRATAVAKMLTAVGYTDVDKEKALELCEKHLDKFWPTGSSKAATLSSAARELVARGLMEEILDRGLVPEKLREAGLR